MSDLNAVTLVGNLVRDPSQSSVGDNIAMTKFTLAVNDRKKEASFVDCTAFRKTAEFVGKYFHKGEKVGITGELKQDNWENKNGEKRSKLAVIVNSAHFVGGKSSGDSQQSAPSGGGDVPF